MGGVTQEKYTRRKEGGREMGRSARGKRDGTGPYAGSYRRRGEGKKVGRRRAAGVSCPWKGGSR